MLDEPFSGAPSRLRGVRVLIVEDSWIIAKGLESLLEDAEIVVTGIAATTAEAERLARDRDPRVAIVDVHLRGETAFDLIDHLYNLGIEIVVASGSTSFPRPLTKAAAILEKPFRWNDVLATLLRIAEAAHHPS